MKKVMLAFCLLLGGIVTYAQQQDSTSRDQQQSQYPTMQGQDQDREKINSRDLPDAIKRSLEGQEYRGWLVNAAYKSKGTSDMNQSDTTSSSSSGQQDTTSVSGNTGNTGAYAQEMYVVELKNGAQTKTVRFDKDGKKLDGQGPEGQDNK
ncbi:hypothetical protein KK083_22570 [Fulvivirgaceae bacterium PWU4]|uniref:Beta-lactamase-inhibitor-like PepSY-like domain-containing protein n=1 Tax=Chryseosolibacter histidini TaxID=2782349 RepID=A0AAP2DSJ0_9BACT|nr:hypothetical protein [Chryseosolibacter histidini]MBT1699689.1 hypothetical protein [Chryseosolibacter histidini]